MADVHDPDAGASTPSTRPQLNTMSSGVVFGAIKIPSGLAISARPPWPSNVIEKVSRLTEASTGMTKPSLLSSALPPAQRIMVAMLRDDSAMMTPILAISAIT